MITHNEIIASRKATESASKEKKITVLGTSNGAYALTADLCVSGYNVKWSYLQDYNNPLWQHLNEHKSLNWTFGFPDTTRKGEIDLTTVITTEIDNAITDSDIIILVTTANRQQDYFTHILKHDLRGKILVFLPARLASLRFNQIAHEKGIDHGAIIIDVSCLLYSSKIKSNDHVHIKSLKVTMPYGVFPASAKSIAQPIWESIFPQYYCTNNVIESALIDPCIVTHPVTTIFNASRIAHYGGEDCSCYNISKEAGNFIDKVDLERLCLLKSFRFKEVICSDILCELYGLDKSINGKGSYVGISSVPWYAVHKLPKNLKFRYINEDIPYGLVPMEALCHLLNINCQYLSMTIDICNTLNAEDYRMKGYTLEKIGLGNMSLIDINTYMNTGAVQECSQV